MIELSTKLHDHRILQMRQIAAKHAKNFANGAKLKHSPAPVSAVKDFPYCTALHSGLMGVGYKRGGIPRSALRFP